MHKIENINKNLIDYKEVAQELKNKNLKNEEEVKNKVKIIDELNNNINQYNDEIEKLNNINTKLKE